MVAKQLACISKTETLVQYADIGITRMYNLEFSLPWTDDMNVLPATANLTLTPDMAEAFKVGETYILNITPDEG